MNTQVDYFNTLLAGWRNPTSRKQAARMNKEELHAVLLMTGPTSEELKTIIKTTTSYNIIYDVVTGQNSRFFLTQPILKQVVERYASGELTRDSSAPPLDWFFDAILDSPHCDNEIVQIIIEKVAVPDKGTLHTNLIKKMRELPEYSDLPDEWIEPLISTGVSV